MKKIKVFKLYFFAAFALFSNDLIQAQNYDDADISVTILTPIECTKGTNDLVFGAMQPDQSSPSTLTVSAAANPTVTPGGGSNLLIYSHQQKTAADFNLTGTAYGFFQVTLPNSTLLTNITSGNNETMVVDNFTTNAFYNRNTDSMEPDGTYKLYVGGTLNIGAAQALGAYSGTFTITVDYQ